MKKALTAFLSYSRVERLGIAVLAFLILAVLIVRAMLTMWVHPPAADAVLTARLNADYEAWKSREQVAQIGFAAEEPENNVSATLFPFDPNTLDSAEFLRLGISAKAIHGLLNWRRHGKHFYEREDLKPLYNLPAEQYERLLPYISITDEDLSLRPGFKNNFAAIPAIIELNSADSALLDRGVNGIGATLAHKIIARRTALGGFVSLDQLSEVYKFPDTTFRKMKEKLHIDLSSIHKMSLNTATLEQMSAHPYIGEKIARNILLYRQGIKTYRSIEELREVPLMNEEIYRKIAPYFAVE